MMASLLVQGIIGGDKTIGITTLLFFSSLVLIAILYVRRQGQGEQHRLVAEKTRNNGAS
jgi:hypothetical protein